VSIPEALIDSIYSFDACGVHCTRNTVPVRIKAAAKKEGNLCVILVIIMFLREILMQGRQNKSWFSIKVKLLILHHHIFEFRLYYVRIFPHDTVPSQEWMHT